jgi:D-amino-acid oxidase
MEQSPIVVVGAGVVGLSVAVRLAEAGYRVQVLAREMPLETTSARAAAIWYPYRIHPPSRTLTWASATRAVFAALSEDPETGVTLRPGTELLRNPSPPPWWAVLVPDLHAPAELRDGYLDGWSFVTPVVEMPMYLRWLQGRLESLGGSLERVDLAELPAAPVVVNCSGLGARTLVADESMTSVRGQVLLLSQVGLDSWLLDGEGLTYVIPRSSDIVVGGTDDEGCWDTSVDPGVAACLLGRATALEPRLAEAAILGHSVGLRPARPEVRLEAERLPDGRRVVHCYGHGGAGVTVSWGCADEVAALLPELSLRSR